MVKQIETGLRPIVRTKKARNRPPSPGRTEVAPPTKTARGTDHDVAIKQATAAAGMPLAVRERVEAPKLLWDRANMIRHLKNAADVRVEIKSLGTTVRVVKSELIDQFRAVAADGEYVPPDLAITPEGLVLVFRS